MYKVDLFGLNIENIERYLNIIGKNLEEFITIRKLYDSDLSNIFLEYDDSLIMSYEGDYYVKVKHLTTQNNESLDFFMTHGFLNLREMLTNNESMLYIYLKEFDIVFDVENNILNIANFEIFYADNYDNRNYCYVKNVNNGEIIELDYTYDSLNDLRYRLNICNGETEFYYSRSDKNIFRYSCVREYPEILETITNLLESLLKDISNSENSSKSEIKGIFYNYKIKLVKAWKERFNKTYLVEGYANLINTNVGDTIKFILENESIRARLNINKHDIYNNNELILNSFNLKLFSKIFLIYSFYNLYDRETEHVLAIRNDAKIIDLKFEDVTNKINEMIRDKTLFC